MPVAEVTATKAVVSIRAKQEPDKLKKKYKITNKKN